MKTNYTQKELDMLEAYFKSLGNPIIEWKEYEEEWGHKDQESYTNKIENIGLCGELHFRIKDDPHWELREKWVLSNFTLPIEALDTSNNSWYSVRVPAWIPQITYREKPIDLQKVFKETFIKPTAENFLDEAKNILSSRGEEYEKENKEENSFLATASAFNAITGKDLSPAEVALLLQILKDVRQWAKPRFHKDSAVDCINYAALKAKLLFEQYEDKK